MSKFAERGVFKIKQRYLRAGHVEERDRIDYRKIIPDKDMYTKEERLLTLFGRIEAADRLAFEQLHRLLYSSLYSYAYSLLKSRELAEEATSDMFIKLWTIKEQLGKVTHPQLYMFRSLKNICLNILRREKRKVVVTDVLDTEKDSGATDSPEDALQYKELMQLLTNAVASLPEQRRLVFTLIKEQGMKSKEVADLLEISLRTVENHLYKAVKQLTTIIELYLDKDMAPKRRGRSLFSLFLLM